MQLIFLLEYPFEKYRLEEFRKKLDVSIQTDNIKCLRMRLL
jgi:hypothetical protein